LLQPVPIGAHNYVTQGFIQVTEKREATK